MRRGGGLPWLLLAVLVLLGAGAAALGLSQAPSSANLAAHNAVGQTLLAPNFTAVQHTSSTPVTVTVIYTAPDTLRIVQSLRGQSRATTTRGPQTKLQLQTLSRLQDQSFTKVGSRYLTQLSQPVQGGTAVEHEFLTLNDGFLVGLEQHITVTVGAQAQHENGVLRFVRIGDWVVPAG